MGMTNERNCEECIHATKSSGAEPCLSCLEDMPEGVSQYEAIRPAVSSADTVPPEGAPPTTPPAPSGDVVAGSPVGVAVMLLPDRDTYTRQDLVDVLHRLGIPVI